MKTIIEKLIQYLTPGFLICLCLAWCCCLTIWPLITIGISIPLTIWLILCSKRQEKKSHEQIALKEKEQERINFANFSEILKAKIIEQNASNFRLKEILDDMNCANFEDAIYCYDIAFDDKVIYYVNDVDLFVKRNAIHTDDLNRCSYAAKDALYHWLDKNDMLEKSKSIFEKSGQFKDAAEFYVLHNDYESAKYFYKLLKDYDNVIKCDTIISNRR